MKNFKNIKSFGFIYKKEELSTWKNDNNFNNYVLKVNNLFLGYKCKYEIEHECKPNCFYFTIESFKENNEEQIIKISQKIRNSNKISFSDAPGILSIFNKKQYCIGIELENQDLLEKLIDEYKLYGVTFKKNQKVDSFVSMLKINKFLELKFITKDVFSQKNDSKIKYLSINKDIKWIQLEQVVQNIKTNNEFSNVDFALTNIHYNKGFEYFVRIYSDIEDINKLLQLKSLFNEKINNLPFN